MGVDKQILLPNDGSFSVHPAISQTDVVMKIALIGQSSDFGIINNSDAEYTNVYVNWQDDIYIYRYNKAEIEPIVNPVFSQSPANSNLYTFEQSVCNYLRIKPTQAIGSGSGFRVWFESLSGKDIYTYLVGGGSNMPIYSDVRLSYDDNNESCVIGFVKHSASIPGCSIDDVVLGIFSENGITSFCVNGIPVWSRQTLGVEHISLNSTHSFTPFSTDRNWDYGISCYFDGNESVICEYDAKNIDVVLWSSKSIDSNYFTTIDNIIGVTAAQTISPIWQNYLRTTEIER